MPLSLWVEQQEILFRDYVVIFGLVVLYWDHILTFADEVQYFWRRPTNWGMYCFFVNRYLAFFSNLPMWIANLYNFDQRSCGVLDIYHQAQLFITQCYVGGLLGLRLYALYACSKKFAAYLLVLATILVSLSVWGVVTSYPEYNDIDCTFSLSSTQGPRTSIAWLCLFVWDLTIVSLILWKSHNVTRINGRKVKIHLISLIARDGLTYFICMLLANGANTVSFFVASSRARGSLSTFASAVSVSMMSRLMINLHKDARHLLDPTTVPNLSQDLAFHDFYNNEQSRVSRVTTLDDEADVYST